MEELRSCYADRFVISCVNQKTPTAKHCQKQESRAVLLSDEGRGVLLPGNIENSKRLRIHFCQKKYHGD